MKVHINLFYVFVLSVFNKELNLEVNYEEYDFKF